MALEEFCEEEILKNIKWYTANREAIRATPKYQGKYLVVHEQKIAFFSSQKDLANEEAKKLPNSVIYGAHPSVEIHEFVSPTFDDD